MDELCSEPWGTLVQQGETNPPLFVKYRFSEATCIFLVTDLQAVWVQSCDKADIKRLKQVQANHFVAEKNTWLIIIIIINLCTCQEHNPLVDTPVARILQLVKYSLLEAAIRCQEQSSRQPVNYHANRTVS